MKTSQMEVVPRKKNQKRRRLEKPKKQYAKDQCALYGIKGLGQLTEALQWPGELKDLLALSDDSGAYRVWQEQDGRWIQEPTRHLRAVHTRVAVLLRRILPPDYRQSGVRSRSFLSNAANHLDGHASLKLDIKSFYPSTTFGHVRRFFVREMKCAPDVAARLAQLCCYQRKHVPTGGVHSEVLAFFCHKEMFEKLLSRVKDRGGRMTVYVDDIMVTMPNASITDLEWTRKLFAGYGMRLHPRKSTVLRRTSVKCITGVWIRNGKMLAPKQQHSKAVEIMRNLKAAGSQGERVKSARSLIGHLDHIAQIDQRFKQRAIGNRARLKDLLAS